MAGIGDSWGTADEIAHPRDSHGRWRSKWKLDPAAFKAVIAALGPFSPHTFQSDGQATQYTQNLAHRKPGRFQGGSKGYARLISDYHDANNDLLDGNPDEPSTKKFVEMMDQSMIETPEDMIVSMVTGPDAFGLTPERISEIENLTNTVIANRGYQAGNLGTPNGGGQGQITMSIATPKGTKMAVPGSSPTDRSMFYDRDQELTVTKVKPDGRGGYNVWAVATPKTPGDNPPPVGGHAGPGNSGDREAAVKALQDVATKREMGEQGESQLPGGRAAGGLPEDASGKVIKGPPGETEQDKAQRERATRRAAVLGRPASSPEPAAAPVAAPEAPAAPTPTPEAPAAPVPAPASTPAPSGVEVPAGATSVVTGNPAESFRDALTTADLPAPSKMHRQEFNDAINGISSGKRAPQDVLRDLDSDIESAQRSQDLPAAEQGALDTDVERMQNLAELIRKHFSLGEPKHTKGKKEVRAEIRAKEAARSKKNASPGGGSDRKPGEAPGSAAAKALETARGGPPRKTAPAPKTTQEERGDKLKQLVETNASDDAANAAQRSEWSAAVGKEPKELQGTAADILLDETADLLRNGRVTRPKAVARLRDAARDTDTGPEHDYLRKVADLIEADTSKPNKRVPLKKVAKKTVSTDTSEKQLEGRTARNILTGVNGLDVGNMRALAEKWGVETRGEDGKLKLKAALAKDLAAKWKDTPELQKGVPAAKLPVKALKAAKKAAPTAPEDLPDLAAPELKAYKKLRADGVSREEAITRAIGGSKRGYNAPGATALATPERLDELRTAAKARKASMVEISADTTPGMSAFARKGGRIDAEAVPKTPAAKKLAAVAEDPDTPPVVAKAAKAAAQRADRPVPGVDYKDPAVLDSEHARDITEALGHGDSQQDIIDMYVQDGIDPKMAKLLVSETVRALKAQGKMPGPGKKTAAKKVAPKAAVEAVAPGDGVPEAARRAGIDRAELDRLQGWGREIMAEIREHGPGGKPEADDGVPEAARRVGIDRAELDRLQEAGREILEEMRAGGLGKGAKKTAPPAKKAAPRARKMAPGQLTNDELPEASRRVLAGEDPGVVGDEIAARRGAPPAPPVELPEPIPTADYLRTTDDEDEARTRLSKLLGKDLDQLATETGVFLAPRASKKQKVDTLVRENIQRRKASDAISRPAPPRGEFPTTGRAVSLDGPEPDRAVSLDEPFKEVAAAVPDMPAAPAAIKEKVKATKGPAKVSGQDRVAVHIMAKIQEKDPDAAARILADMPEKDRVHLEVAADLIKQEAKRVKSGGPDISEILKDGGIPEPKKGTPEANDREVIKGLLDSGKVPSAQARTKRSIRESEAEIRASAKDIASPDSTAASRAAASANIERQQQRLEWLRGLDSAFEGNGAISLRVDGKSIKRMEIDQDLAQAIKDASADDLRESARLQGVKLPESATTKDEIMTEVVREIARRQLAGKDTSPKLPDAPPAKPEPTLPKASNNIKGDTTEGHSYRETLKKLESGDLTPAAGAKEMRASAKYYRERARHTRDFDMRGRTTPEAKQAAVDRDLETASQYDDAAKEFAARKRVAKQAQVQAVLADVAAKAVGAPSPAVTGKGLREAKTEAEADKLLDLGRGKAPYQALADELGIEYSKGDSVATLKEKIKRNTVTSRLTHDAYQRATKGIVATEPPAPAKKAVPKRVQENLSGLSDSDLEKITQSPDFGDDQKATVAAELARRQAAKATPAPAKKATKKATKAATQAAQEDATVSGLQRMTEGGFREEVAPSAPAKVAKKAAPSVGDTLARATKATPAKATTPGASKQYTRDDIMEMNPGEVSEVEEALGIKRVTLNRQARADAILAKQEEAGTPAPAKQEEAGTPAPAKKAAAKATGGKIQAGVTSDKPKLPNKWGGDNTAPIHIHPDSAISEAIRDMGADAALDVDGDRLDNVLGRIGTGAGRGDYTSAEMVDRLRALEARLPASKAKTELADAIKKIDQPTTTKIKVPEGTPGILRSLAEAVEKIPLAHAPAESGRDPEVKRIQELLEKWAAGDPSVGSATSLRRELRKIHNSRHESMEGKLELDRAIREAIAQLDVKNKTSEGRAELRPPNLKEE